MKRRQLGIPNLSTQLTESVWTGEVIALLGKVPNAEIARRFGIDRSRIAAYRSRHRILSRKRAHTSRNHNWIQKELAMLDTNSDSERAKKIGVSRASVARRRNLLGIAPFSTRQS